MKNILLFVVLGLFSAMIVVGCKPTDKDTTTTGTNTPPVVSTNQ